MYVIVAVGIQRGIFFSTSTPWQELDLIPSVLFDTGTNLTHAVFPVTQGHKHKRVAWSPQDFRVNQRGDLLATAPALCVLFTLKPLLNISRVIASSCEEGNACLRFTLGATRVQHLCSGSWCNSSAAPVVRFSVQLECSSCGQVPRPHTRKKRFNFAGASSNAV